MESDLPKGYRGAAERSSNVGVPAFSEFPSGARRFLAFAEFPGFPSPRTPDRESGCPGVSSVQIYPCPPESQFHSLRPAWKTENFDIPLHNETQRACIGACLASAAKLFLPITYFIRSGGSDKEIERLVYILALMLIDGCSTAAALASLALPWLVNKRYRFLIVETPCVNLPGRVHVEHVNRSGYSTSPPTCNPQFPTQN